MVTDTESNLDYSLSISNIVCHNCGYKVSHYINQNEINIIDNNHIKIIFKCASCHNILTKTYKCSNM